MFKGLKSIFAKPAPEIKVSAAESDLKEKHYYFLEQGNKMLLDCLAGKSREHLNLDYYRAELTIDKEAINWRIQFRTSKDFVFIITYDRTRKTLEHAYIKLLIQDSYHFLDCSNIPAVKDIVSKMAELDRKRGLITKAAENM